MMPPAEMSARSALKRCADSPTVMLNDLGQPHPSSGGALLTREECMALLDVLERWRLALAKLSNMTFKSQAESRKVQGVAADALYPKNEHGYRT